MGRPARTNVMFLETKGRNQWIVIVGLLPVMTFGSCGRGLKRTETLVFEPNNGAARFIQESYECAFTPCVCWVLGQWKGTNVSGL